MAGVIMQFALTTIGLLVPGCLIAGVGVGFVSAIIILYMSEIAPKAVRAIVSGYQFFIESACFLPRSLPRALTTTSHLCPTAFPLPSSVFGL